METLSVNIITKNEESNIKRCLDSVSWTNEIIIIDSGSTDSTISICKEYTNNIYIEEWSNYAEQRNKALKKSTCDWILVIDADEELTEDLIREIRSLLNSGATNAGYMISMKNYIGDQWLKSKRFTPNYQLRLFKREGAYFHGAVHERVNINGEIGMLKGVINHFTYKDLHDYLFKVNKYTTLEIQGKKVPKFLLYHLLVRPMLKFIHEYFFKKGYRNGWLGLTSSIFLVLYDYLIVAKLLERENLK
ncbi:glycosyltransferase family 2 protein [Cohnella xylanilytica]|uniref:Glycosyltransferase family 2 protein n=1 Tax=Cohnella xylanilytica TaxID=557555 RepID=A0A841U0A9_9BACL|nr:glycosyltransferase family 2 protein [Cohnella xylanilytica]MBB6693249.1 glycosyltransferase family 2 protein [Cohnella xylanilytica]